MNVKEIRLVVNYCSVCVVIKESLLRDKRGRLVLRVIIFEFDS